MKSRTHEVDLVTPSKCWPMSGVRESWTSYDAAAATEVHSSNGGSGCSRVDPSAGLSWLGVAREAVFSNIETAKGPTAEPSVTAARQKYSPGARSSSGVAMVFVVVTPLDGLEEDPPQRPVEPALVGRFQRCR